MTLVQPFAQRFKVHHIGSGSGDVFLFGKTGAPTSGTTSADGYGWAGTGTLCVDANSGVLYINTGTGANSITWAAV